MSVRCLTRDVIVMLIFVYGVGVFFGCFYYPYLCVCPTLPNVIFCPNHYFCHVFSKNSLIVRGRTSGKGAFKRFSGGKSKTPFITSRPTKAVTSRISSDEYSAPAGIGGMITLPAAIWSAEL